MNKIVLEDFNEGNGYYKVNLAYLNKEQVEEIENLVAKWKPTDEDIKSCIGMCLTDANEQRFKDYNTSLKDCLDWFEKKTEQKSINLHDKIEELCSKYPINKYSMNDEELSSYHQGVHLGATKIAEYLNEQKSVEWSEEDEDMRDTIIRDLKHLGGDMVNVSPAYKEEVDWLKSLRPSWKPSEEQLGALQIAAMESKTDFITLTSLLADLKKLI